MARILIVDDEVKLGKLLMQMLEGQGYEVERAQGGRAALDRLKLTRYDVVVTDLRMPDVDGLTVLREARRGSPGTEVVMMTAFGNVETAVEAMRLGAADYLTKPFAMDEFRIKIRRLVERAALEGQARVWKAQAAGGPRLEGIVAQSAAMREVIAQVLQVAQTETTVLLTGPSGTGKTLLARALHAQSPRRDGPLAEVHCEALPEGLLESELFGHERGAFTGASEAKAGQLELAGKGTLFLDEIGEVSPAIQLKLLRFVQDRRFMRVGSTQLRQVDVRIVAATNRDLEAAVKEGLFREDFYYRLNVFPIRVPPLSERRDDVPELAAQALRRRGHEPSRLSAEALEVLTRYAWPGNVRELENVLERALILAGPKDALVRPEHLPRALVAATPQVGTDELLRPGFSLDQLERDLIHQALERTGGNKTEAARLLGITRRRLYSRLKSMEATTEAEPPPDDDDSTSD